MSNRVNIFHYATSELSQDAVISWLLAWADPKYDDAMHELGSNFVKYIHSICKVPMPGITKVEVPRKTDNIDVQCRINDNELILIEDKVGTKQHSNQLQRYLKAVTPHYSTILPVYIQTGDQSDYSKVHEDGYTVITRRDILGFFEDNSELRRKAENRILEDFVEHLENIERSVQSYKTHTLNNWTWESWIGFYQELQKRLGEGGWSYVANPSGGFLGFWWCWCGNNDGEQYLQLEQERLCFKICCDTKEKSREIMYKYSEHFIAESKRYGIELSRPARLRAGIYTTVAILDGYRKPDASGIIDMEATVSFLRKVSTFLTQAVAALRQQN